VIAGFIALAVIIGFSFAACGGDDDNGGNSGSPFDGTWVNDADATDTITINNPNWTRTKGSDLSGILHYDSAPSPDTPNIRDTSGSNIGEAKIVGGKLHWDIGWAGAVIFSKGTGGGNNGGNGGSGNEGNGGNGNNNDAKVKVINNYSKPITKVEIEPVGTGKKTSSTDIIESGNNKTFSVIFGTGVTYAGTNFTVYAEGLEFSGDWMQSPVEGQAYDYIFPEIKKTVTVTLTIAGELIVSDAE